MLLAVCILALSGVPCKADDDCCMGVTHEAACTADEEEDCGEHQEEMPCSPFFSCGAVHAITVPEKSIELPAVPVFPFIRQYFYSTGSATGNRSVVWQPPRLVF